MRSRPRYSLRSLLLLSTAICLILGWGLGDAIRNHTAKQSAARLVDSLGGTVSVEGFSTAREFRESWFAALVGWSEFPEALWKVDLAGTKPTRDDLEQLARCRWIRVVDLSNTPVGDRELAIVARTPDLARLSLMNTKVTDGGLAALHGCSSLLYLDANGTAVTYAGLEELDAALQGSNFAEMHAVAQGPFPGVQIAMGTRFSDSPESESPSIRRIDFVRDVNIMTGAQFDPKASVHLAHLANTETFVGLFAKARFKPQFLAGMKNLRMLTIDGGELTDADFGIIAGLKELRYLNITGWHHLTDEAVLQLGENRTLRWLNLNGLETTLAITEHLNGLRALETLTLNVWVKSPSGANDRPTPEQIAEAVVAMKRLRGLPRLREVSVQGNIFTDEVMLALVDCRQLTQIEYDGAFVSAAMVAFLRHALPGCDVVDQVTMREIDLNAPPVSD